MFYTFTLTDNETRYSIKRIIIINLDVKGKSRRWFIQMMVNQFVLLYIQINVNVFILSCVPCTSTRQASGNSYLSKYPISIHQYKHSTNYFT